MIKILSKMLLNFFPIEVVDIILKKYSIVLIQSNFRGYLLRKKLFLNIYYRLGKVYYKFYCDEDDISYKNDYYNFKNEMFQLVRV